MKMNRIILAVLPLVFSTGAAFAQSPESSIRESTDPARVAEVERRAQELRSAPAPMQAERHDGKQHHGKKHNGDHRMHEQHPKGAPGSGK